jgi:Domain of unknown function (DUF4157)/Putative peptidoglycan binding domain
MNRQATAHALQQAAMMTTITGGVLQRQCACGNHTVAGSDCDSCQKEQAPLKLQRAAVNAEPVDEVPQVVHDVLRSSGQPLDIETRAFMEQRFGHDFSHVRVHTDGQAAESARAVNALAYTVGRDVVFGAGQHAPQTEAGRRLLAHELTHVVQQGGMHGSLNDLVIGDAHSHLEHQANEIGLRHGALSGAKASPEANGIIQRDLATPEPEEPQPEQPELTAAQIREAINFNSQFYNEANTRLIQSILGGPVTGRWTADNIRAIAETQEQFGLKKDGKVGPDTFRFIVHEQELEDMSTDTENCLTAFRVIVHPVEGAATPGPGGTTRIRGHHVVEARFSSRCNCSEFEYRQFIAGVATGSRGGAAQNFSRSFPNITGGSLPVSEVEDGKTHCSSRNYGHRKQPGQTTTGTRCPQDRYVNDADAIDQDNGCSYRGEDFPQLTVSGLNTGDTVDLLIQFRGEIRRNDRVIQTKRWTTIDQALTTP